MKRPAFQFYPADWRKDVELRSCSVAARGLWIDLLCIAHECEPYGHLTVNARPMTLAQIAGQVGLTQQQCAKLIDELIANGVAREADHGAIYSKRMVEDERIRNVRAEGGKAGSEHGIKGAEHGKKGGRPPKERGDIEPPFGAGSKPPLEPPPSSSSSSASEEQERAERVRALLEAEGHSPTPSGLAYRAMREAGLDDATSNDPRLLALLEQGATVEELRGIAAEAARRKHGFAWALATLVGRRADAAAIALAAAPPATVDGAKAIAETAAYLAEQSVAAEAARSPEAQAARRAAMSKVGRATA